MFVADGAGSVISVADAREGGVVVVREGQVLCCGAVTACTNHITGEDVEWVDLEGGSISYVISTIQTSYLLKATHPALALSLMAPHLD